MEKLSKAARHKGSDVRDRLLVHHLRAKLRRYVSHSNRIAIAARRGNVDLSGDVKAAEYGTLLG